MNDKKKNRSSIIGMNLSILKYVFKFCPILIVFAIFNIIASAVVAIGEVKIISDAIDAVINTADTSELYKSILIYVIVVFVCYIFKTVYRRYILARCRIIFQMKMQTFLFRKVKHIDMASYDNPTFYDKYSRGLNDGTWRGIAVFTTFTDFIEFVVVSASLGVYAIIADPLLIVIILVCAVISVISVNVINKIWYKLYHEAENDNRYTWYIKRTFYQQRYAAELKTTKISSLLINKYDERVNNIEHLYRKSEKKMVLPNFVSTFANNLIQQAGTYIYLFYKLSIGMAISTFTAMVHATFKFASYLTQAISIFTYLREHSYYISDFLWILDYTPSVEKNEGLEVDEIESINIKDICFAYPKNDYNSINHLSLNITKGEKIAIVGDNGGGKTTLIKLLMKFYIPTSGTICINGKNIEEYNEISLRKQYSIVFQDFQIYAVTIAENVLMRRCQGKEDEQKVLDALDKVGLLEKILSFKDGIYTNVTREFDKDGVTFSGGERQRLVIARIFASDANVYILDEPTSSLDPLSEERINKLIIRNVTNKTMIIIAHRLSTVVDADRIYLIRNGEIKESGSHEELMEQKGIYYTMFDTQRRLYVKEEKEGSNYGDKQ